MLIIQKMKMRMIINKQWIINKQTSTTVNKIKMDGIIHRMHKTEIRATIITIK